MDSVYSRRTWWIRASGHSCLVSKRPSRNSSTAITRSGSNICRDGDDVMIMGAWGAYEKGWAEVGPRYDWAAARFTDSGATSGH